MPPILPLMAIKAMITATVLWAIIVCFIEICRMDPPLPPHPGWEEDDKIDPPFKK